MKKKHFHRFSVIMIAFILVLSCLPAYAEEGAVPEMDGTNWMRYLPNEASIGAVNLPGTHDSGCAYFSESDIIPGLVEDMAWTQDLTIPEQLEAGLRVFDIRYSRAGALFLENADKMIINHGGMACRKSFNGALLTLEDVIQYMRDFLKAHPTETVVLYFAREYSVVSGMTDTKSDEFYASESKFFTELRNSDDVIYVKRNEEFPTVGEARGKIVTYPNDGLKSTHMYYEKITYKQKWEKLSEVLNDSQALDYNWRPHLSNSASDADRPRHIGTNCYGDTVMPVYQARPLNSEYLKPYNFQKGTYYGWITMDFASAELAAKIYKANYFDFDAEGNDVKYISDVKFSYAQDFDTARSYLEKEGYTVLTNNFNDEGADKPYSTAVVNGRQNNGSFNIAVGYKTSARPEDAVTGMIWQYAPPENKRGSEEYQEYKKKTDELVQKYNYKSVTLCGTYEDPDGYTPQSALDMNSFNIGTAGYTVDLMITHDPAAGNCLVDIKDLKTYLKTDPNSKNRASVSANKKRAEYFSKQYRSPRDVNSLMFGSNYGRDSINDIMLFYRQASSRYFDSRESDDAAYLPGKTATFFGPKTMIATCWAAVVLLAVIAALIIRKRKKGNTENA